MVNCSTPTLPPLLPPKSIRRIPPTASSQRRSRSSFMANCGRDGARQPEPTSTVGMVIRTGHFLPSSAPVIAAAPAEQKYQDDDQNDQFIVAHFFPFVCLPATVFAIQSNRFSLSHASILQQAASAVAEVVSRQHVEGARL